MTAPAANPGRSGEVRLRGVKICVLVGGVGGAKFLLGVREVFGDPSSAGVATPAPQGGSEHDIAAVVNVGDDAWMHGLRICPDLDTCMYTLGGGIDTERGWGHAGETWNAKAELAAYGVQPDWFGLGDRDIGTHLVRTQMLNAGFDLTDVTEALCRRWAPGVRLLPVTDDRSETHVIVADEAHGGAVEDAPRKAIHFQEWWVRYRAQIPTDGFTFIGSDEAKPSAAVLEAISDADVVLIAPSNPVVSVGAILAIPGIRGALRGTSAPIVGISPIIGGAPLRGMADRCLEVEGVDTSAASVAGIYGARDGAGLLDAWLVAPADGDAVRERVPGLEVVEAPLIMSSPEVTAEMVRTALRAVGLEA